jgi:hypothetical protein
MEAAAHDPAFARKAHIPQSVGRDFVNADKRAGKFSGKSQEHSMARDMDSGINEHKRMGMGQKIEGEPNFGAGSLHGESMPHPDAGMDTGADMGDKERGMPIKHHPEMMHAQAAPDHGPHHHKMGRK